MFEDNIIDITCMQDGKIKILQYPYLSTEYLTSSEVKYIKGKLNRVEIGDFDKFNIIEDVQPEETNSDLGKSEAGDFDAKWEDNLESNLDSPLSNLEFNADLFAEGKDTDINLFGEEGVSPFEEDNNDTIYDYVNGGPDMQYTFLNTVIQGKSNPISSSSESYQIKDINSLNYSAPVTAKEGLSKDILNGEVTLKLIYGDNVLGNTQLNIDVWNMLNFYFRRVWILQLSKTECIEITDNSIQKNILNMI